MTLQNSVFLHYFQGQVLEAAMTDCVNADTQFQQRHGLQMLTHQLVLVKFTNL